MGRRPDLRDERFEKARTGSGVLTFYGKAMVRCGVFCLKAAIILPQSAQL